MFVISLINTNGRNGRNNNHGDHHDNSVYCNDARLFCIR